LAQLLKYGAGFFFAILPRPGIATKTASPKQKMLLEIFRANSLILKKKYVKINKRSDISEIVACLLA
jgi:hypothetical protein